MGKALFCDSHVHIGKFRDLYFDPIETANALVSLGIDKWAVSSTTTALGSGHFDEILQEFDLMETATPGRSIPVLWLAPDMLKSIENYLLPRFKALKLHGRSFDWKNSQIEDVFLLADQSALPLIIHTGGNERNDAGFYFPYCVKHPKARIVLAHGRPLDQTLTILSCCPNVCVDTAFMPIDDIVITIEKGFGNRILWGSDFPLAMIFYPEDDPVQRLQSEIHNFRKTIPPCIFDLVCTQNFFDVFET